MTDQISLTGNDATITPAGKPLPVKQQRAFDLVRTTPGGITADELGAVFHADRGKHHPESRCEFCSKEGTSVLESVAVRPLVVRRKASGRWEARDGSTPPVVQASSQLSELPGETWEEMFGGAA